MSCVRHHALISFEYSVGAVIHRVAQLKKYAKSLPGSVYVRDRRDMNTPEAVERSPESHVSEKNDHHDHLVVNDHRPMNH